jgi:NTP pyrophosphatase (non-canonical NTP hydrolase)
MSKRPDLLPTTFNDCVAHVIEECGEVLQAIGKFDRFGAVATDAMTGVRYDNVADLLTEMDDLESAIGVLRKKLRA